MKRAVPLLAFLLAVQAVTDLQPDPEANYCLVIVPGEGPIVEEVPDVADLICSGMDTGED